MELLERKKSEFYENEAEILGGKSDDIIEDKYNILRERFWLYRLLSLSNDLISNLFLLVLQLCYHNFMTFFLMKLHPHSVKITSCNTVRKVGLCEEQRDLLSLWRLSEVLEWLTLHWELQLHFAQRWRRHFRFCRSICVRHGDVLLWKVLQRHLKHVDADTDLTRAGQCARSLRGQETIKTLWILILFLNINSYYQCTFLNVNKPSVKCKDTHLREGGDTLWMWHAWLLGVEWTICCYVFYTNSNRLPHPEQSLGKRKLLT